MKFLLLLLVVAAVGWMLLKRGSRPGKPLEGSKPPPAARPVTTDMLACARCGVHVPGGDVLRDAQDRPFCSEAHRAAGPR